MEEVEWLLWKDGLQINLDKLFMMNKSGSLRDVEHKNGGTGNVERAYAEECNFNICWFVRTDPFDFIEERDQAVKFVRSAWIFENAVLILEDNWEENKV